MSLSCRLFKSNASFMLICCSNLGGNLCSRVLLIAFYKAHIRDNLLSPKIVYLIKTRLVSSQ